MVVVVAKYISMRGHKQRELEAVFVHPGSSRVYSSGV